MLKLYTDITRGWLQKTVKIDNLIKGSDIEWILSSTNSWGDSKVRSRFTKVQVRISAILNTLIKSTNKVEMPGPLIKFLSMFVSEGSFVPKDFLTMFEKNRLELD